MLLNTLFDLLDIPFNKSNNYLLEKIRYPKYIKSNTYPTYSGQVLLSFCSKLFCYDYFFVYGIFCCKYINNVNAFRLKH